MLTKVLRRSASGRFRPDLTRLGHFPMMMRKRLLYFAIVITVIGLGHVT